MSLAVCGTAGDWFPKDLTPVRKRYEAPAHKPVVIVHDGAPTAVLVVHGNLRKTVAAVQKIAKLATGRDLPTAAKAPAHGAVIIVGDCPASRAAGIDASEIPPEGFVVKTAPDRIFIVGNGAAGNAHGLAAFAERILGGRWYFPQQFHGLHAKPLKQLSAPPVHFVDAPVYRKRQFWPPFDNVPAKGMRYTDMVNFIGGGNSWPWGVQCHTPHWGRNKEYREKHPEVFALRNDGSRNFGMICYSHPKTLKLYLAEIEAQLKGDVSREQRRNMVVIKGKAISVSPADLGISCLCEHCKPKYEPDEGQFGNATSLMADFVARLGRQVKKRWPDMIVTYLPYVNYTLAPDDVELPDNVQAMLCGMPGVAMYKEPAIRKRFQANIDAWRKLTGRKVETWEYSCWPADRTQAPYQYPHVLKSYYRHNTDRLVGTFINGTDGDWVRQHITLYIWIKLMWNPELDVDAVLESFAARMYGPAGTTIQKLLRLQTDRWEDVVWEVDSFIMKPVYEKSFTKDVVQQMKDLLQQARREVGDDAVLNKRLDYYAYSFAPFFKEAEAIHSGKGMRQLVAKKVGDTPVIDGKLDDPVWQTAPASTMEKNRGKAPTFKTEVKAVWTLDGITFGFKCDEPDPDMLYVPLKSADDPTLWHNDNVELFLDVTGKNEGQYYQFIISPRPTVYDSHNGGTTKHGAASWKAEGLKVGVHRGDGFWSMEVYLPYTAFEDEIKPGTGVQWIGQFTRHRIASAKKKRSKENPREYSRLNFQFGGPSNNTGDFAPIKFVE